jgi:hypothetical protein
MRHQCGRNGDGGTGHDANGSRYHRLMVPYKLAHQDSIQSVTA